MNANELLTNSIKYTNKIVSNLANADWRATTTCPPWTLRELLNHVTYEWLWAPDLFAGKTVAEVGNKYEGDVLGDDPFTSYKKAADKFLEAAKNIDQKQTIHLSYADVPASEYMFQLTIEALIHGWDIATSSGKNNTLPTKETKELYNLIVKHYKEISGTGMYGHALKTAENADTQTKLLALLGRKV